MPRGTRRNPETVYRATAYFAVTEEQRNYLSTLAQEAGLSFGAFCREIVIRSVPGMPSREASLNEFIAKNGEKPAA
ncbi:MAG: hypothetical protein VKK04_25605 [Synechococcales bacterium]|nr:hypothetical protein [Synechococcales bacterium]